ncbi:uncharacterized protein F5Z01DRAFT_326107 [Emericellopsis atlantica]|uniref:Uncharacterized protein n=1 Tax=Emericellopsis atlantica TaxID=2614577 RepID=A0A9P8CSL5_9HYPO|nr:uncharacterized protein F5Z01DRAFT_326107 [Emericellopsis atlantica]KAG9258224.1 hypothetical protein F5Z01DRAFT_326107 [Emericellopsis atlantica]
MVSYSSRPSSFWSHPLTRLASAEAVSTVPRPARRSKGRLLEFAPRHVSRRAARRCLASGVCFLVQILLIQAATVAAAVAMPQPCRSSRLRVELHCKHVASITNITAFLFNCSGSMADATIPPGRIACPLGVIQANLSSSVSTFSRCSRPWTYRQRSIDPPQT